MAKNDDRHALYLINPDTQHVELVHADDVADRKADGWAEPTNTKPNGDAYNREEDFPGQDAAAVSVKAKASSDEKADKAKK